MVESTHLGHDIIIDIKPVRYHYIGEGLDESNSVTVVIDGKINEFFSVQRVPPQVTDEAWKTIVIAWINCLAKQN